MLFRFLEGPWSDVMKTIHDCHTAVHKQGAPRIATDIRIGTRIGRDVPVGGENARKLASVQQRLGKEPANSDT